MELLYLGTAAAEGYPALFCQCAHCTAARRERGRSLRRRTSALIDGELLIDVGPDLLAASHALGLDLSPVRYVLQTHRHSDHLLDLNFLCREPGFAGTPPARWELRGSRPSIAAIAAFGDTDVRRMTLEAVAPFQTFTLGPYTVTALLARHDMAIDPLFYAIRRGDKALLWGNDTGPFFPETWEALQRLGEEGVRFNVAAIEATLGAVAAPEGAPPGGHMTIQQCADHHNELERRGLLAPGARRLAHHFSHNNNPPHAALEALLRPHGVEPAYDGLRLRW